MRFTTAENHLIRAFEALVLVSGEPVSARQAKKKERCKVRLVAALNTWGLFMGLREPLTEDLLLNGSGVCGHTDISDRADSQWCRTCGAISVMGAKWELPTGVYSAPKGKGE